MSTLQVDRPVDEASAPVAVVGRAPRPFVAHVLALTVVLAIGFVLVRPSWPSLSDEGAALAQVDSLSDGDGWLTEHPLPSVDPDGVAFPIDLSQRSAGTNRYAPLAKHPAYAAILQWPYRAGGVPGAFAVGVVGTLVAAVSSALLARRLDARLDRLALWLVGVGSPLLYDAYLLVAHSLGAAFVGLAVLALTSSRRRGAMVAPGLACLLAAQLLRNEAVLFGIAFGLGSLGVAAWHRWRGRGADRFTALIGIVVLGTTAVAYRLDERLAAEVLGEGSTSPFTIASGGSFVHARGLGFLNSMLRLPEGSSTNRLLVLLTFVALVIGVRRCLNRSNAERAAPLFAIGGGLAALAYLAGPGELIYGFVFAAPLLVCGLLLVDPARLREPFVAVLVVSAVLFVLAVLATQYADAGNSWGGRYLAIVVPIVAPLAALGLDRGVGRMPRATRGAAVGGLVLVGASLAAMAVTSMSIEHRYAAAVEDLVASSTRGVDAGDGDPRPVVVATGQGFGRLLWPLVREQRWLHVPDEDLATFAPRLRDEDITRIVVVTATPSRAVAELAPWYAPAGEMVQTDVSVPLRATITLTPTVVVFVAR